MDTPSLPFGEWRALVDKLLVRGYAITIQDAGIDDDELARQWMSYHDPQDYVDQFARKYDLDPVMDGLLYPLKMLSR